MTYLFEKVLLDKARDEFKNFSNYLLSLSPAEILNHTYEYTIKQDVLLALESLLNRHLLNAQQVKAMSQSPCPLEDLYKQTEKYKLISSAQLEEKGLQLSCKNKTTDHP